MTDARTQRIRESQPEQVPVEGGRAKDALPLWAARLVSAVAWLLPLRLRVRFIYATNFLFNRTGDVLRMAFAWLSLQLTGLLIGVVYWLVLGPTALIGRLLGQDDLRLRPQPAGRSYFTAKEPPDTTAERFARQY